MKYITVVFFTILFGIKPANAQFPPDRPDTIDNIIFTKVEVEASFPGGFEEWKKYLMKNLRADRVADYIKFPRGKKELIQTVIVKFIVAKDGSLHDISAENNDADPHCITEAIRVIKASPNWVPAQQNGRVVNAYRRQPITFAFER